MSHKNTDTQEATPIKSDKPSIKSHKSGIKKKEVHPRKISPSISDLESLSSLSSKNSMHSSHVASRISDYESSVSVASQTPIVKNNKGNHKNTRNTQSNKKSKKFLKSTNLNEHRNQEDMISFQDSEERTRTTSHYENPKERVRRSKRDKFYLPKSKELVSDFHGDLNRAEGYMQEQRDYYYNQPYSGTNNYQYNYNPYSQSQDYYYNNQYSSNPYNYNYDQYSCNYYPSGHVQVAGQQPTNWVYDESNINYNKLLQHSYY